MSGYFTEEGDYVDTSPPFSPGKVILTLAVAAIVIVWLTDTFGGEPSIKYDCNVVQDERGAYCD